MKAVFASLLLATSYVSAETCTAAPGVGGASVIRSDTFRIQSFRDSDMCIVAHQSLDTYDVSPGNKGNSRLMWQDCSGTLNATFNNFIASWEFVPRSGKTYGQIKLLDSDHEDRCWHVTQRTQMAKSAIVLKRCVTRGNGKESQRFFFYNGSIWFFTNKDSSGDNKTKYCVPFDGAQKVVKTRECFDTTLGG